MYFAWGLGQAEQNAHSVYTCSSKTKNAQLPGLSIIIQSQKSFAPIGPLDVPSCNEGAVVKMSIYILFFGGKIAIYICNTHI